MAKHVELSSICCIVKVHMICLFERPFQIQKNGSFLFEISFFVLEILTFFYYANYISDDIILLAAKNGKILNKRYLWKY